MNHTWLARNTEQGRLTVLNDVFRKFDSDGELVSETGIEDEEALLGVIREHFGLDI